MNTFSHVQNNSSVISDVVCLCIFLVCSMSFLWCLVYVASHFTICLSIHAIKLFVKCWARNETKTKKSLTLSYGLRFTSLTLLFIYIHPNMFMCWITRIQQSFYNICSVLSFCLWLLKLIHSFWEKISLLNCYHFCSVLSFCLWILKLIHSFWENNL